MQNANKQMRNRIEYLKTVRKEERFSSSFSFSFLISALITSAMVLRSSLLSVGIQGILHPDEYDTLRRLPIPSHSQFDICLPSTFLRSIHIITFSLTLVVSRSPHTYTDNRGREERSAREYLTLYGKKLDFFARLFPKNSPYTIYGTKTRVLSKNSSFQVPKLGNLVYSK